MMFSKLASYAIRAMVFMVRDQEKSAYSVTEIANALGGSKTYLSKVMQKLVEAGYLASKTGPGQGYSFIIDPNQISIYNIIKRLNETDNFEKCFFGWAECCENNPCPFHDQYKLFLDRIIRDFQSTNLIKAEKKGWPQSLLEDFRDIPVVKK